MTEQLSAPTLHPQIQVLSDEQVQVIHASALQILQETGVEMQDTQAHDLLLKAGAWESGGRIKIPEKLVKDALHNAPSRIPMYNRLGELTMPLELGNVFWGPGSDTIFTLDIESGERRFPVTKDVENFAQVSDALDNIDFVMCMGSVSDVPPADLHIHEFISMIRGSVKPNVYTAKDCRDLEDIYKIGVAVAGGEQALREKPFFLLYPEPISPLLMPEESIQKLIFCAEKRLPTGFVPSTNCGGGGPITLAGAIALGNAECLAGLVIAQLVNPGTPFLYGFNAATLDMKTTIVSYGCPEWSLSMMAGADMARFYGLPVWGFGGSSDSKEVDAQFGAEATFSIMSAFLSRTTLVHDVGYIEYGSTSSIEALIIADEIIGMTRFLVEGVDINPTTLALDAIGRARPGGGFIMDDHTLDNWRWAQWRPEIIDRSRYDRWEKKGSKDIFARANERAHQILAEHEIPPISEEVEAVIAEVLAGRQ